MINLTRHPARRAAVGVLAGTVALSVAAAAPAQAVPGFDFERLAGEDRYETAARIATSTFTAGATTAIIARGDVYADALAANYLAGVVNGPVLLTPSDRLSADAKAALQSLGVDRVAIAGGPSAVSRSVEDELRRDYEVVRYGGDDRYATAELIAKAAASGGGTAVGSVNGRRTAILGSGQDFPDVLASGPLSYARQLPIAITRPDDLPPSTEDVLRDLNIQQVVIVGQTAAVSEAVEAEAEQITGNPAIRLGGQVRWDTAALIAEFAYDQLGFDETKVDLARGDSPRGFADALAGGPHSGEELAPIVLTLPTDLPAATRTFLEQHSDTLADGHIFGGTSAVSTAVELEAEEAAQGEAQPNNEATVTVTSTTVNAGEPVTGKVSGQNIRSVTVSGCGLNNEPVNDTNTSTEDVEFSEIIPTTQPAGPCTLTFTTTFDDGTTETDTVQISVASGATVVLTTTAVEAGSPVTGRIEGTSPIRNATVSGCGLTNEPVEDRNTGTAAIEFSETIPGTQTTGSCTLTFTVTFENGTTDTDAVTINVTRGGTNGITSVTVRPELLSATFVGTTTNNNGTTVTSDDFAQTSVRFNFDEEVFGKSPVAADFHLVTFDGSQRYDGQRAIIESGGTSVLVTFGTSSAQVGSTQFRDVSLATVDAGAVQDNEGLTNPIQDAPLDTSRTETSGAAGITSAPDLVAVQNFRLLTATATATAVDFVFDEEAFVQDETGFHLIRVNGTTDITCTATTTGGTRTITVTCPNDLVTGSISASQIARGYVETGTVNDAESPTLIAPGNDNPLEAADVSNNGNSDTPDLVSGQFLPTANRDSSDDLEVRYVFDEPVFVGQASRFVVYKSDGSQIFAESARREVDANKVIATFAGESLLDGDPDPLENSVGVSVLEGAVTKATGVNLPNQEDEVGIDNPASRVLVAGRTENPDLVRVEIGTSSSGSRTGVYVFDEGVIPTDTDYRDFRLYLPDGGVLLCAAATVSGDSVTCTQYTSGGLPASSAQIAGAILGTVDNNAVQDQTTARGPNPEGAEPVANSTAAPKN